MIQLTVKEQLYQFTGARQHAEFERELQAMVFDRERREQFYRDIIATDWGRQLEHDTFRSYFEEYAAERKSNQQDYTPGSVAFLLARFTENSAESMRKSYYTGGDITAGTGALIIQKWWNDCIRTDIFDYRPHDYVYIAQEYADNAIPYLLHNLAMRGMNCVVIHGDTLERTAKNIYLVQNAKDDFLAFSSINVMPRSETVANWFGIKSFVGKPIEYIEDTLESVIFRTGGSMDHERFECAEAKVVPYVPEYNAKLKDIATIERAKAKKQYPAGTIVIQMSATRGQTGLLKSSGEVPTHYACIQLKPNFNPQYMHLYLKYRANPRHFHRVQEGLNLTLENIETIPIIPWVLWLHGEIDLLTQEEYEDFMEHSRF